MKKVIFVMLIVSILLNIGQFIVFLNHSSTIDKLYYTESDKINIYQSVNQLERNLYKYEINKNNGTYYFQAISECSMILTYMQYNIKYKDSNDPLFQLNLALNNLFGFLVIDQGKEQLSSHLPQIRDYLHIIANPSEEKERTKAINELGEYMLKNLTINLPMNSHSDKIYENQVPAIKITR